MYNVQISYDVEHPKTTYILSVIAILVGVFFYTMPFGFGLIFFIVLLYAYWQNQKIKYLTYDKADFIYIKDEIKIPITAITEISVFSKKRNIWHLNYLDENLELQTLKFAPIEFTFNNFKQTLLEKNKNVLIEDFIYKDYYL